MLEIRTYDYGDGGGREVRIHHGASESYIIYDSENPTLSKTVSTGSTKREPIYELDEEEKVT